MKIKIESFECVNLNNSTLALAVSSETVMYTEPSKMI